LYPIAQERAVSVTESNDPVSAMAAVTVVDATMEAAEAKEPAEVGVGDERRSADPERIGPSRLLSLHPVLAAALAVPGCRAVPGVRTKSAISTEAARVAAMRASSPSCATCPATI